MFTNWLTDNSGLTTAQSSASYNKPRITETNNHLASSTSAKISNATTGLSLSVISGHNLTNLNANIMSTAPDIVLEVGPAPTTMRFMAHGLVLGMHSGYLRSAIRLDECGGGGGGSSGASASNVSDLIVYLTNVTPEQFAPLLTYMYTGYLDLNVENIFGVLLATHVLHMPRALEICRSYLARAQTEGYFGPNNNALASSTNPIPPQSSGKIIRPIASKPQLTNFGFLPLNHHQPPLALSPIASNTSITPILTAREAKSNNSIVELNKNGEVEEAEEEDDIDVDEVDKQSLNNENQMPFPTDEEEDVEVFIDSNSEAEVVVETQIQKLSFRKLMENKKTHNEKDNKTKRQDKTHHHHKKSSRHNNKSERRRKGSSSGLQVAKAPVPASQLDCSEANKVIIDVASCDGPVRFKRILNTAYGHKPDPTSPVNCQTGLTGTVMPERSLQSVSLSFHQQMAKTISQQQLMHQTEESENSETSNGSMGGTSSIRASEKSTIAQRKTHSEVFVCVYCKHTFKSQYCYQKHAKRHLNPLTLQATCVPEGGKTAPTAKEEVSISGEVQITKHQNVNTARGFYSRNATNSTYPTATAASSSSSSSSFAASNSNTISSSDYLRREVRPLDMNVQYYPCKTCGCKFPSYYFVHKHRKMCHAEEEAAQQTNSDHNITNSAQITAGVGTTTAGSANAVDCLNSQSSN